MSPKNPRAIILDKLERGEQPTAAEFYALFSVDELARAIYRFSLEEALMRLRAEEELVRRRRLTPSA